MKRPTRAAPPPAQRPQQSSGGGFLGTMMQGMAFGTGSAVAHEAVHAGVKAMSGGGGEPAPGPGQQAYAEQGPADACAHQSKAFLDCMQVENGQMSACQYYFDRMQQCKLNPDTLG